MEMEMLLTKTFCDGNIFSVGNPNQSIGSHCGSSLALAFLCEMWFGHEAFDMQQLD